MYAIIFLAGKFFCSKLVTSIFVIEVFDIFLFPTSKPARKNICFAVLANVFSPLGILQNHVPIEGLHVPILAQKLDETG